VSSLPYILVGSGLFILLFFSEVFLCFVCLCSVYCVRCCLCLLIVHSWLSLWFTLTFI
jgi:hypothetical protein